MTDSGSNGYCFHQMNITVLKKLFEYKIIGELKFLHRKYYKYWHAANAHTSETRDPFWVSVLYCFLRLRAVRRALGLATCCCTT